MNSGTTTWYNLWMRDLGDFSGLIRMNETCGAGGLLRWFWFLMVRPAIFSPQVSPIVLSFNFWTLEFDFLTRYTMILPCLTKSWKGETPVDDMLPFVWCRHGLGDLVDWVEKIRVFLDPFACVNEILWDLVDLSYEVLSLARLARRAAGNASLKAGLGPWDEGSETYQVWRGISIDEASRGCFVLMFQSSERRR